MNKALTLVVPLLFAACASLPCAALAEKLPLTVAGITLGDDISKYEALCQPDTAVQLRDEMFLTEVSLKPNAIKGVRGGALAYGNDIHKGQVVRLKIKFDDDSLDMFNVLLDRFKKRFGDPGEWQGDPFHVVISWKWSIADDKGGRVDVVLTHSKDPEFRPGVSIKMLYRSMWDAEWDAWRKAHPPVKSESATGFEDLDLSFFTPQ